MSNKTRKQIILTFGIVVFVLAVIVALIFYIKATKNVFETVCPDTTSVQTDITCQPVLTIETTVSTVSETTVSEVSDEIITIDADDLFNPVFVSTGSELGDLVYSKNEKAITVEFDSLTLRPGMTVCDITTNSDWHTICENEFLKPREIAYAVLTNDYWNSDEFKLNCDPDVSNCEIVVWVRNYSDEPQALTNCPIYKYKISCKDGIDVYKQQPVLKYMDKYHFGYKGTYPAYDAIEHVSIVSDDYVQLFYGDIDECLVTIDKSDDYGLFAITVFYNEYYAPMFGREG